nr:MAG TPA: conotoxin [Caudoviricetes sp.]
MLERINKMNKNNCPYCDRKCGTHAQCCKCSESH